jgi:hypothetical protein
MTTANIFKGIYLNSLPKFNTIKNARNYINRGELPGKYQILMGDDNLLWVVNNRQASILKAAGYEAI